MFVGEGVIRVGSSSCLHFWNLWGHLAPVEELGVLFFMQCGHSNQWHHPQKTGDNPVLHLARLVREIHQSDLETQEHDRMVLLSLVQLLVPRVKKVCYCRVISKCYV